MNANNLKFDLFAMAQPKSRLGLGALALELIREIENFNSVWDAMIARIESAKPQEA